MIAVFPIRALTLWLLCFGEAWAGNRALDSAGFAININFQTAGTAIPSGYLADCGDEFGDRGNGFVYGWNVRNTTNAFERHLCSNKLLDTGHKMKADVHWKIKVPNGLYDVVVGAGDPSVTNRARYHIKVQEDTVLSNSVPDGSHWWFGTNTHIQTCVTNRCLTLSSGPGAIGNTVCYIRIKQVAPILWGAAIIDNANRHKCPVDYLSEAAPGVLGYYENHVGKRISLLHWGNSWSSGSLASQTNYMARMWARGTIPVFSWSPSGASGNKDFSLASIISGKHDAFLTNWFQVARAFGKPFFLNFAREMNGTWYTWSEGHPINEASPPGSFTNMWRHVRDICTGVGCTNITWVWVADRDVRNEKHIQPLSRFYPGDDYVDWAGIDLYNAGSIPPYTGESFQKVYGETYSNVVRIAPNKPIMICETGTKHLSATPKPAWISEALMQLPSAYPNIRAFIWFNWNDGNTNKNWPIQGGGNTLPYMIAPVDWESVIAFSKGIASPFYLGSIFTNQANLFASPIMPIILLPPPSNVVASVSRPEILLRWSAVPGATAYNVYRGASNASGPLELVSALMTDTKFIDEEVVGGITYYYVVTAQNLAGESVDSLQVNARAGDGVSHRVAGGS